MQFFIHLLRHPGDGLSLLEQEFGSTFGKTAGRSGLLWGFSAEILGAPAKTNSPAARLESWLAGRQRPPGGLWKSWGPAPTRAGRKGRSAAVGVSLLTSGEGEGRIEALDRLRRDSPSSVDTLHLALPLETCQEALPKLESRDRLAIYWEVGDVLTESLAQHLQRLAEHLEEAGSPPAELRLYSRWPDPNPDRLQAICESLGRPTPSTVPTAKEATWQIL